MASAASIAIRNEEALNRIQAVLGDLDIPQHKPELKLTVHLEAIAVSLEKRVARRKKEATIPDLQESVEKALATDVGAGVNTSEGEAPTEPSHASMKKEGD
jgi:hypothetical protein